MEKMFLDDERVVYRFDHIDREKETLDISKIDFKYHKLILKFYRTLVEGVGEENSVNFIRRIKDASIKRNIIGGLVNKFSFSQPEGEYFPTKNKIVLYIPHLKRSTLNHELLHLASSYISPDGKIVSCGLDQENETITLGTAINEGYTELLNCELFHVPEAKAVYEYQRFIIAQLLKIVPKEEMNKFYFNGDLYGLITKLLDYNNPRRIKTFLTKADNVQYNQTKMTKFLFNAQNIYYVNFFLIETYTNYLLKLYKEKQITKLELEYFFNKFIIDLKEQLDFKLSVNKDKLRKNIKETKAMFLEKVKQKI